MAAHRARLTRVTGLATDGAPHDARPEPAPTPLGTGQLVLAASLVLSVALVAFEITAAGTVLPTISDELGGDSLYGVASAVYTLANLIALVAAGLALDKVGPVKPYVVCMIVFVLGLVVAAAANSMTVFVVGRALQGANGGFGPIAYSLVRRAFPEARQPKMYAFIAAGWVLPSLIGPFATGGVTDAIGWRWVFSGITPLAAVVCVVAVRAMWPYRTPPAPESHEPAESTATGSQRLLAAVAAAGGLLALAYGLQLDAWPAALSLSTAAALVAAVALRRLLPRGTWRAAPGLAAAIACRIIATGAFLCADYFIPLAGDRIHEVSATVQGALILGAAVMWSVGQWLAARNHEKSTPQRQIGLGMFGLGVGIAAVMPVVNDGWPLWAVFIGWSIGGLGMGYLYNAITVAAMSYAENGREGAVSSQVSLADAIGFSVLGGVGGAVIAVSDRGTFDIQTAILTNMVIGIAITMVGVAAARRVRPHAGVSATT